MLHTPTIVIIFAVLIITAILVHCCNWLLHRPLRGPGWWAAGMSVNAIGITFFALRYKIPEPLSIIGGSTLIMCGLLIMLHGLYVFAGRRLNWRIPACFIGMVFINNTYFTLVDNSVRHRWLVVASLIVAIKCLALSTIRRIGKRDGYLGTALLAGSLTFEIFFYLGHANLTFFYTRNALPLSDTGNIQSIGALIVMTLLVVNTFGYVLLTTNRSQAELHRLALIDPLTGLVNRRVFDARLQAHISSALRNGTPLSLLFFDLDYFKQVNDNHGHQAGDELLKHFARLGLSLFRVNDDFARLGGEEFALLAPGADNQTALKLAERMRSELENSFLEHDGVPLKATVSAGIATLGPHGSSANQLTRSADEALYAAKMAGRNRVSSLAAKHDLEPAAANGSMN